MGAGVYTAYLGTNSLRDSLGIYQLEIDASTLEMRVRSACRAMNADYLDFGADGRFLYAALEVIYHDGEPRAAAAAYRVEADGSLAFLNEQPIAGQMNCFAFADGPGGTLYSASYLGGTVTANPIRPDGSLGPPAAVYGEAPREGRHRPSVHAAYVTPDRAYLLSCDVGLDALFLYDLRGGGRSPAGEVPVEGRPRQAAFSGDGRFVYVSTESGGEVFVFAYSPLADAKLRLRQRISTCPAGWTGRHAETAGIKLSPDGRLLCVANRAKEMNDLAVFAVDRATGLLAAAGRAKVGGAFPRDFAFTPDGRYLLVGAQFSDELELFEVDYDGARLVGRAAGFRLPCCSCVRFAKGGDQDG